ncbi:kinase-like protein [Basidiobolus meristosporus CBS 931.73]|uniref:non-specific serine/threonine protein kinase n=1 Tax=Basidiobolus meristosporus CBS 931.73 TaxID=1314790 RepID=A0A1Y1XS35_9FUNG|nr:kinase-like protein [Basidiobolus meristosporus CBS 931.73]|eukprot:ORX88567.1 kinase-like protein [Basidiobolus meristosporus CBS 931.73]
MSKNPEDGRREVPGVVGIHYRVGKKIGMGSFGVIYEGTDLVKNQQIAIKFEAKRTEVPQLRDEYRTYKILAGTPGIPAAYYFNQEDIYNVLVIDLLGPSLEDLFESCHRKFSVKTVAMLSKQMLARVESVHEHNLIYRDIKPDNFLIGRPHSKYAHQVFMVDFGMAKYYRDPKTKQHIPYRERKSLSGTARYMSINTHLGREQSRRDDLEALGHVIMYFLRGALPWQGLKAATNKQKYQRIGETKQTTPIKELGQGFPEEFGEYLRYARELAFDETPDYKYLRGLFDRVLEKLGERDDGMFDWMLTDKSGGNDTSEHGSQSFLQPERSTTPRNSQHRPQYNKSPNSSSHHHRAHRLHDSRRNISPPSTESSKGFWARLMEVLTCRSCCT